MIIVSLQVVIAPRLHDRDSPDHIPIARDRRVHKHLRKHAFCNTRSCLRGFLGVRCMRWRYRSGLRRLLLERSSADDEQKLEYSFMIWDVLRSQRPRRARQSCARTVCMSTRMAVRCCFNAECQSLVSVSRCLPQIWTIWIAPLLSEGRARPSSSTSMLTHIRTLVRWWEFRAQE